MEKALVVVDEIFSAEEMAIALEEDLKDAARMDVIVVMSAVAAVFAAVLAMLCGVDHDSAGHDCGRGLLALRRCS